MTYPVTQAREPVRPDTAGTGPPAGDLRALLNAPGSRTVLLDASRDPNSCVTILVMAPGAPQPHLAVKVATTPAAGGVIEREADFLARLPVTTPLGIWETPPRCAPTSRPPGTGSPPCTTTA
jgi:hypothetical protein